MVIATPSGDQLACVHVLESLNSNELLELHMKMHVSLYAKHVTCPGCPLIRSLSVNPRLAMVKVISLSEMLKQTEHRRDRTLETTQHSKGL